MNTYLKTVKPYAKLTEKEEYIGKCCVDAAFKVHSKLGPGLLEKVYEICFCHELKKMGLSAERQVVAPIDYDGIKFDEGFKLDVLVEDLVVCELKAQENPNPVWEAQIISHLKLVSKRLGYLINFNVTLIKGGIKRIVV